QIITTTYIDDYRTVMNLMLPYYSEITVKETMFSMIFKADTIEINQPLDLSIFELPLTKVIDYYFPENVKDITIPFEYRLGHIRLPLVINGTKKVWVILDSGASASIFHKPVIDKLDFEVIGKMPAMGVSGFNEVDLIQTDSVQIGNLTLYNHVAGVIDLGKFSDGSNGELDFGGIIGYNFLSRFPVLINYQDSTLTVFNPAQFEPPEGGEEISFHLMMQVPTIEGEILGIKGNFLVDLGNSFGLVLHKQFALQNRLEEILSDIKDNPRLLGGVSGSVSGKNAFAATFKMGNILIQSLRVLLPDSTQGITGSSTLAGNIGNLVLENFTVLFDYPNSRIFFYQTDSKMGN
ncbi:MAG: pepsin/retropepsin-like aspartic protease family protein, partial [Candidatus Zixiibacteriota bacterium]